MGFAANPTSRSCCPFRRRRPTRREAHLARRTETSASAYLRPRQEPPAPIAKAACRGSARHTLFKTIIVNGGEVREFTTGAALAEAACAQWPCPRAEELRQESALLLKRTYEWGRDLDHRGRRTQPKSLSPDRAPRTRMSARTCRRHDVLAPTGSCCRPTAPPVVEPGAQRCLSAWPSLKEL